MTTTTSTVVGSVPVLVVVSVGVLAATVDLWTFKVHNAVTFPFVLLGLVYHATADGLAGFGFSLAGTTFGFAALILFYAMGGIGAGDVKLMAGIGAWLGAGITLHVILLAGLATGLYALVLLLFSGGAGNVMTNLSILAYRARAMAIHFGCDERVEAIVRQPDYRRRRLIPFAAMVAIGLFGVLLRDRLFD